MNFQITGCRADTGQDVSVVVDVPNRVAAETWAHQQRILWDSIAPTTIVPQAAAPKYSFRNDPVVWLSVIALTGVVLIFSAKHAMEINAQRPGYLPGHILGLALGISAVGSIGALIARLIFGKRRTPVRAGFLLLAGLTAAGYASSIQRQATLKTRDTAAAQALLDDARATLASQTASTAQSSSNSTAMEQVTNAGRVFMHEGVTLNKEYHAKVKAIVGNGLLVPSGLDSAEKIAAVKARLVQLGTAVDEHEQTMKSYYKRFPTLIDGLPIAADFKQDVKRGYGSTLPKNLKAIDDMAAADRKFIDLSNQIADLLNSRLDKFHVKNARLVFEDDADLTAYNQLEGQVEDVLKEENNLTQQQQAKASQSLDQLGSELSKTNP